MPFLYKTFLPSIVFTLMFFVLPSNTFAISGACSSHGGVSCSAGADWDGSVICNDGWTDSSVSYSSMVMCQTTTTIQPPWAYCTQPIAAGYTSLSSCNQLQSICDKTNASKQTMCARMGAANADACVPVICTEAELCKAQVANYTTQLEAYNQCVEEGKKRVTAEIEQRNKQLDLEYITTQKPSIIPTKVNQNIPLELLKPKSSAEVSLKPKITSKLLKKGANGLDVSYLQTILARDKTIYPEALVTGYFGPATEKALQTFQRKYNLEPVGYVGPKTRNLLNVIAESL